MMEHFETGDLNDILLLGACCYLGLERDIYLASKHHADTDRYYTLFI